MFSLVSRWSVGSRKRTGYSSRRALKVRQFDALPDGTLMEWPRPVQDGEWVDPQGVVWRMKEERLTVRAARKLFRNPDVAVAWAYELTVAVVTATQRADLNIRLEAFLTGDAPPHSHFDFGDFRDPNHRRLLIVEESC